ncbi:hypothetical protein FHEFKHOI_01234 [Candidatus Methanoperedenaceae archaeon GB50]|nr:MAG: hypothetical protein KBONHNOK_00419 [Candidatus Methanoperedenaceae archaeon GB50]CAD7772400.1 hypothetical protein AIOGIFDO_01226 [Candidatus Methanoperedenaceae archaeon GB37]CAD7772495.1 hypothetical protein FHEFKHOI_01234 [Candidatus Methanoperedenaceae archaeon GB50]
MSFIRYKKFGNKEYAYEVTSYWDPEKKKPRQKTKYLGVVVDKEKKIFKKKSRERKEKLILDFGDTYFLNQFINRVTFFENLKKEMFLPLIFYRLCYPSAMRYARMWYEGNIVRKFFDVDISSQRISEFLEEIGDESIQREFFKEYIRQITPSEGIVIDTTALPNQINIPRSSWGWHNEEIEKQIKLLLVIDRSTSLPLFFRYIAGNIVDVSTLKATVEELSTLKATVEEVLLTLRNLKCKVYEDEIIVQELTKQQRKIFEKFSIMVPKSMGI